ncbi:MAG TPA: YciI family protein [Longimicrobiales bacterium]|nr:YciI family protein [Longimicrobiales bacterium]
MRYMLLLHYWEATAADLGEETMEAGKAAFHAYAKALDDAGVLVSAEVLQPSPMSTTVTVKNGSLQVQDGPYADTKEQLGGIFVLDVPDLDAALAWAEKCPAAQWGSVEIRPSAVRFAGGRWVPA